MRTTNLYLDETARWHLAGRAQDAGARRRLETVLAVALGALRVIAVSLSPFLPELAARLAEGVGSSPRPGRLRETSVLERASRVRSVGVPPVLVPRLGARTARNSGQVLRPPSA